jgi:hypothetical protein
MAEPLNLGGPAPDPAPVDGAAFDPTTLSTPPAAPAASPILQLTQAQLDAMLTKAVQAGQAQAQAVQALGAPAVQAEKPEEWSVNQLLHAIVRSPGMWHTERQARSAAWSVDKWFPVAEGEVE